LTEASHFTVTDFTMEVIFKHTHTHIHRFGP